MAFCFFDFLDFDFDFDFLSKIMLGILFPKVKVAFEVNASYAKYEINLSV